MRRLLVALAVLALTPLAPHAAASDDLVVYLEADGWFAAGLVAAEVDGVSAASFVVTPVEGFHALRFQVGFEPEGVEVTSPVADALVRYRMQLSLRDNETGEPLAPEPAVYNANGTRTFVVADERPVLVTLSLVHGADVAWTLRVSALPDPKPVE